MLELALAIVLSPFFSVLIWIGVAAFLGSIIFDPAFFAFLGMIFPIILFPVVYGVGNHKLWKAVGMDEWKTAFSKGWFALTMAEMTVGFFLNLLGITEYTSYGWFLLSVAVYSLLSYRLLKKEIEQVSPSSRTNREAVRRIEEDRKAQETARLTEQQKRDQWIRRKIAGLPDEEDGDSALSQEELAKPDHFATQQERDAWIRQKIARGTGTVCPAPASVKPSSAANSAQYASVDAVFDRMDRFLDRLNSLAEQTGNTFMDLADAMANPIVPFSAFSNVSSAIRRVGQESLSLAAEYTLFITNRFPYRARLNVDRTDLEMLCDSHDGIIHCYKEMYHQLTSFSQAVENALPQISHMAEKLELKNSTAKAQQDLKEAIRLLQGARPSR